jgi:RNA polymerase sigma-70 factor (ECF subfamily)
LSDLTEAALVARAVNGNAAAFEILMRSHNQLLFRTARSIVRRDADAEDVVQEAYLRAWRALPGYRGQSRLATWLVRIAVNEALGRLRRTSAQIIPLEAAMASSEPEIQAALTEPSERDPEQSAARAEMRALVEARIDRLPETFRTVFMLRAVEGMRVKEIARALDIPEATVRTRFFRARSQLRESLAHVMDIAVEEAFAFDGARCDRIVAWVLARGHAEGLAHAAWISPRPARHFAQRRR